MFNRKTNRVIRYATDLLAYEAFPSARTVIPDWYKKTPKLDKKTTLNRIPLTKSFKACSPFLDGLSLGYMFVTPCDIGVDNITEQDTLITWGSPTGSNTFAPISLRPDGPSNPNVLLPIPEGFSSQHFIWNSHTCFSIPKGYSVLVTHPFNRHDLPFLTLTGVVDGKSIMPQGNIPVFFSKGFNGIIPKGTPFAQIVPFKRENWDSKEDAQVLKEQELHLAQSESVALGWYKANRWKKKTYN